MRVLYYIHAHIHNPVNTGHRPNVGPMLRGGRGGGVLALEMGRGVSRHVQNLTLSQFASRLKTHPVPIWKLTPNLIDQLMV